jgi:hypothetical protein
MYKTYLHGDGSQGIQEFVGGQRMRDHLSNQIEKKHEKFDQNVTKIDSSSPKTKM